MKPRALSLLLAVSLAAAAVAGCGNDQTAHRPGTTRPTATTTTTARASAAAKPQSALEYNAAGANQLFGEGSHDLDARLASLSGHPIVVNQWASWCGPCRFEFPFFAAAVKRYGTKVAFVGVNVLDNRDGAQAFLDEQPPGFPSIYDRGGTAARAIGGGHATPTTLFIGPDGRTRYAKLGGYANAAQLDADIRRYAAE